MNVQAAILYFQNAIVVLVHVSTRKGALEFRKWIENNSLTVKGDESILVSTGKGNLEVLDASSATISLILCDDSEWGFNTFRGISKLSTTSEKLET